MSDHVFVKVKKVVSITIWVLVLTGKPCVMQKDAQQNEWRIYIVLTVKWLENEKR